MAQGYNSAIRSMQTYNFDQIIDRRSSHSLKWEKYGQDVLPLWVADMDFAAAQQILAALRERVTHPIFGYAAYDKELLEIICLWVERRHGWRISPEQVLLMPGVVAGMNWCARTFANPAAGIAIQTPVYPPFFGVARNTGFPLTEVPLIMTPAGYEIDYDDFESKIKHHTSLFILCNPHNPVGRVFSKSELERLGEICLRHGVLICSDEIHCDLVYKDNHHIPIASLSNEIARNTITLMAASKTFNIPGLHFSFAVVTDPQLRARMQAVGAGLVEPPNVLADAAAKAAFSECDEWLGQLLVYLQANRDYLTEFLGKNINEIGYHSPQGTYLAWLDCRKLKLMPDPFQFFLHRAGVALNDGLTFGMNGKGFVRLNFGCPRAVLETALEKMATAVKKES